MSVNRNSEIPKSLAILGSAAVLGVAMALVLSSAPLLPGAGSALALSTRCSGGDGGGGGGGGEATPTGTPTATPTETEEPGPIPTGLPIPGESESPTATATPTPTSTGGTSGGQERCNTEITLSYSGNRQRFSGQVKSDNTACERGRRVLLKRDRKEGRDPTVANTITNREGRYQIPLPDRRGRRFYTKAARQVVTAGGERIECLSARSRTVSTRNPL